MTIREQLNQLLAALQLWAPTCSARVHIASDQVHVLDLLRASPGAPTAALLFTSEDPRGDYSELGMVDRHFKLVLSRSRGFRIDTGESLSDSSGPAGAKPMFDLIEEVREMVRQLKFSAETTEQIPDYRGAGPFEIQGFVLDAFEVRFSIGTQIPRADETPDAADHEEQL